MTLTAMITLSVSSILVLFILLIGGYRYRHTRPALPYLMLCILLGILWTTLHMFSRISLDLVWASLLYRLTYFPIAILPVAHFFLVLIYLNPRMQIRKWMYWSFLLIPLISGMMALTHGEQNFFFRSLIMLNENGVGRAIQTYGIWFYIHCIYSYVFIGLSLVLLMQKMSRVSKLYWGPLVVACCALLLPFGLNVLFTWGRDFDVYDPTLIGILVSQVLYYWLAVHYRDADVVILAKDSVFEHMSVAAVILDQEGNILDVNRSARMLLPAKEDYAGIVYEDIFSEWLQQNDAIPSARDTNLIKIESNGNPLFYKVS